MFLASSLTTQGLLPIIILLGISVVTSATLRILKLKFLPIFAIQIVVGMFLGGWFNDLMAQSHLEIVVEDLYLLGFVLLMFLSGYDADFSVLKDRDRNTSSHVNVLRVTIVMVVLMYVLSFGSSFLFMKYMENPVGGIILLTMVFATTFAGLAVPLVHNKGIGETVIGRATNTFATIAELLSILSLTVYMMINKVSGGDPWFLLGVVAILILFIIGNKIKIGDYIKKVTAEPSQLPVRTVLFLLLLAVLLSEVAGGEYILGAFVTGMLVKNLHPSHKLIHDIEVISFSLFVPMFFIIVGTRIDIMHFLETPALWLLVLTLVGILILVKIPMFFMMKWYRFRMVAPSMLLLSCTIVISLAAEHINHSIHVFDPLLAEAIIIASVITCIIPTIIFQGFMPRNTKVEIEEILMK